MDPERAAGETWPRMLVRVCNPASSSSPSPDNLPL
jgi:hypothetical protein